MSQRAPMCPVRVFLEDDIVLRQLGLHNTFKTLTITEATTTQEMEADMISKMQKGMQPIQKEVIEKQCTSYKIHLEINGSDRVLRTSDKPWIATQSNPKPRLVFKPPEHVSFEEKASVQRQRSATSSPSSSSNLLSSSSPNVASASLLTLSSASSSGKISRRDAATVPKLFSDDEIGDVDRTLVKVMIGENLVLLPVGLHNTFKTIPLTSNDTASKVEAILIEKMVVGMTREQSNLIQEQVLRYRLFAVREGKPPQLFAANDKPWNSQRRTKDAGPAKLLFQLHGAIEKSEASKDSGLLEKKLASNYADFQSKVKTVRQLQSDVLSLSNRINLLTDAAKRRAEDLESFI